jgi:uncharacterized protein (UPF0332 family)
MLDNKKIEEAKRNAIKSINKEEIIKTEDSTFVTFFLQNSGNSLETAKLLFEVSTNSKLNLSLGFPEFNGFLWVINASYYSMFYAVRALLESRGIKLKAEESIHFLTFNALIYYFFSNKTLERKFIEDFEEAGEEASAILGKEKASNIIEDYTSEKEKRAKFTYEMGVIALKGKAETSLQRAKRFNEEIRKLIKL